jgi:hypothetical protein
MLESIKTGLNMSDSDLGRLQILPRCSLGFQTPNSLALTFASRNRPALTTGHTPYRRTDHHRSPSRVLARPRLLGANVAARRPPDNILRLKSLSVSNGPMDYQIIMKILSIHCRSSVTLKNSAWDLVKCSLRFPRSPPQLSPRDHLVEIVVEPHVSRNMFPMRLNNFSGAY